MISHHTDWVIVFDSATCLIFEHNNKPAQFKLLKELKRPENKLKDIELTSDKPGRYKSNGASRSSYTQATDPKEVKIERFMREIAEILNQGRNHHDYKNLIIIAADHLNGLLCKHLNKNTKELIKKNIRKDLIRASNQALLSTLEINLPAQSKKIF